jgi:hypothetical protein
MKITRTNLKLKRKIYCYVFKRISYKYVYMYMLPAIWIIRYFAKCQTWSRQYDENKQNWASPITNDFTYHKCACTI